MQFFLVATLLTATIGDTNESPWILDARATVVTGTFDDRVEIAISVVMPDSTPAPSLEDTQLSLFVGANSPHEQLIDAREAHASLTTQEVPVGVDVGRQDVSVASRRVLEVTFTTPTVNGGNAPPGIGPSSSLRLVATPKHALGGRAWEATAREIRVPVLYACGPGLPRLLKIGGAILLTLGLGMTVFLVSRRRLRHRKAANALDGTVPRPAQISADAAHTVITNVIIDGTRFFQGLNLGHEGKVPSYSRVSNIIVRNAAKFGINVGFGTTGVHFSNVLIDGTGEHGINVSNGATGITFDGVLIRRVAQCGVFVSGGAVSIANADLTDVQASTDRACGGDQTPVAFTSAGGQLEFRNVRLSWEHPMWDTKSELTAQQNTIVNPNISQFSAMRIVPLNSAAAAALPFLTPLGAGQVRLDFVTPPSGPARVRYAID